MSDTENEEKFEEEIEEDNTCCQRATLCNPYLREIDIRKPILTYLGHQFYTWGDIFVALTILGIFLMSWILLYLTFGDTMLPGGNTFGFFALFVSSYIMGWGFGYIPYIKIPPVFGMLLAGIIIRNTGIYNIKEQLGPVPTGQIRTFSLTFIMIRAGLELTKTPLRKRALFIWILALIPCTFEMIILSICCKLILGYDWRWAFLAGSILACMSPAVTMNCLLALAEQGYGEDLGLATILNAAAPIDNVHIVSIFTIFLSILFDNDENDRQWGYILPPGLRDLILGFLAGTVLGFYVGFFPHRNNKFASTYRMINLVLASLICTIAAPQLAISGGGYLASVMMAFIAINFWKILDASYDPTPFRKAVQFMWKFTQPLLVGVIGADIDFEVWEVSRIGLHVLCLLVGLLARGFAVFGSTLVTTFTLKERIFIILAGFPKGTIQAALAPLAFEKAVEENDPEKIKSALDILGMSVVSIVILAPLGAILLMFTGPFLLNKITLEEHQRNRDMSYLHIIENQPVRTRPRTNKNPAINETSV